MDLGTEILKRRRDRYANDPDSKLNKDREWRNTNPRKVKNSKLLHRYGITIDNYEHMLKSQDELCAICKSKSKLYVDHCHDTGKIRGLLCQKCNSGLGMLDDSIENIKRALIYLEK